MKNSSTLINTERETRIFFWFMTLVLGGMFVWVVATQPEMRQPQRLIPFAILLNGNILLHWMLRRFVERPGWTVGYMLVQGAISFVIVILARNIGLTFSLYMALVGEAIGVYGITKRGMAAAGYYLALSLGSFVVMYGFTAALSQIGWWMLGTIPMIIFVVIYVEMYTRQANANERAGKLLEELQAANEQLTTYANQVEDLTIANERQRMARELHDTLSQGLAGLILQLEAADAHLSGNRPEKAQAIVKQTMERARGVLAEARQAIDNLRSAAPDDIEAALRQETARFQEATGISCDVTIALSTPPPTSLREPLQRIAAEALTNIARHAQASHASLHLSADAASLRLEICDDGRGFDPASVPPGHYGLVGMRERARLAGGTLDIKSAVENGTCITITLPGGIRDIS
jgi:NarL family two-component system sensor histidine kinase YdfH